MKVLIRTLIATLGAVSLQWMSGTAASHAADDTDEVPPHARLTQFLLQEVDDPRALAGYRVAILAADGADGFDLAVPRRFLVERGASVDVIVPRPAALVRATGSGALIQQRARLSLLNPTGEADTAPIDRFLDQVAAESYDAVYVPGHRLSVDSLASDESINFLRGAVRAGKPVFAADRAILVIARAGLLEGLVQARAFAGAEGTLRGAAHHPATDPVRGTIAGVYMSRGPFEMPQLMERLVAALVANPAVGSP